MAPESAASAHSSPRRRRWRFAAAAVALSALAVLVAGEIGVRTLHLLRRPRAIPDATLGWRATPHVERRTQGMRADGSTYAIELTTSRHGFRFWGDTSSRQPRLMVIGDSFTEAVQVSNAKTYYAQLLARLEPPWELFAYGEGGYGLLQELLILEQHFDEIRPDAVIWQWCTNDLGNASFAFESRTLLNANPRPYFERGRVRIRTPHAVPILSEHSALWRWAAPRAFRALDAWGYGRVPDSVRRRLLDDARAAVHATLAHYRQLLSRVPVYVFLVGDEHVPVYRELAERHGLELVTTAAALERARARGVVVDGHPSIGGHWSEEGHAVVAEVLAAAIGEELADLARAAGGPRGAPPPKEVEHAREGSAGDR